MRWRPRCTLLGISAPGKGTAAAAMAQCGCPLPLRTPTEPAAPTAVRYRPAWIQADRRAWPRAGRDSRSAPRSHARPRTQPPKPTTMRQAADSGADQDRSVPGTIVGTEAQAPRARMPKNGPSGFSCTLSEKTEPLPASKASMSTSHQEWSWLTEGRRRLPARQRAGPVQPGLVPEAQLVRLGPAVHAGQGTEHRIDHQFRAARGEEGEGRDGDSDGNARCRDVVPVGRRQAVKGAEMRAEGLARVPPFFSWPDAGRGYVTACGRHTPKACLAWFPQGNHARQASTGGTCATGLG